MTHYDFIIAGAGLSGLSLALHLINSPLRDRSILIVDHDAKERNDRTWSYWSDRPTLFDGIACRTWDQLHLAGLNGEMLVNLRRYRYRTIRGSDFYDHARRELAQHPNVTWLRGKVEAIEDGDGLARVIVNREAHHRPLGVRQYPAIRSSLMNVIINSSCTSKAGRSRPRDRLSIRAQRRSSIFARRKTARRASSTCCRSTSGMHWSSTRSSRTCRCCRANTNRRCRPICAMC